MTPVRRMNRPCLCYLWAMVWNVSDVSLSDKETKPPKRLSQGSLIQEMEKLGLGHTDPQGMR
ncbi:MAG: hypothetical protein MZV70_77100 [Desulfobacterales bacterium]|nr:hypothetical protein [Desulfobacterales bacterium]